MGGPRGARYHKQGVPWRDRLLSEAVEALAASLGPGAARYHCLNVVVPTYR